jgi:predicted protein tyrosine phosphatase
MFREVEYLPQARAEYLCLLSREGMISITGSDHSRAKLRRRWFRVLRLLFDDVEVPACNAVHFDTTHAAEILAWLEKMGDRVDKVFVQCHAGKHRSAAVAKYIPERYGISVGVHIYLDYNKRVCRILARRPRQNGILRKSGYSGRDHILGRRAVQA